MPEYWFFSELYFPVSGQDYVPIREKTGQSKPIFWHILRSERKILTEIMVE